MYLGYGRIPWWRWGLVLLVLPWLLVKWALEDRKDPDDPKSPPADGYLDPGSWEFEQILSMERALANELFSEGNSILERWFHPDFVEIGSSGKLHGRQAVIAWVSGRTVPGSTQFLEPTILGLGGGQFLLRYRSLSSSGNTTWRMSLWVRRGDADPSIVYHQGTPVPPET